MRNDMFSGDSCGELGDLMAPCGGELDRDEGWSGFEMAAMRPAYFLAVSWLSLGRCASTSGKEGWLWRATRRGAKYAKTMSMSSEISVLCV